MDDYQFTLEEFSAEVAAAYRRFPGVLEQSVQQVAWKLRDNPFGKGVVMTVRDARGEVVGMNAYQPVVIRNADGKSLRGHQSMDTVVAESARGKGLFTRMYRAYYDRPGAEFVYGFPNKNSAPGFFNKLGWSNFGAVPMRLKPLRTGFLTRRLKLERIDFPVGGFRQPRESSNAVETFIDRHSEAWQAVLRSSPNVWGIDRNAAYLNWRYRDHPSFSYTTIGRRDGSFITSTILDKHGARILYVMEALGTPSTLADLFREVHSEARKQGAELALLWGGGNSCLAGVYRRTGYLPFPPRLRSNEINFGARMFTDGPAPRHGDEWFISYSDSDTV